MSQTKHLKVAIDACIDPGGGVSMFIMGLVHALGQLDDSPEKYIIIVESEEQFNWLKPFIGPNQQLIKKRRMSKRWATLERAFSPLLPITQNILNILSGRPLQSHEVPISGGFYESLGCDVIHFPHQRFTLCALPTVYNPQDLQHLHYPQFFPPYEIAWRETIYPAGCHFAHTVVAASQWVKEDLIQQYQLNPDKVQVIPWAPPTQAYPEPSQEYMTMVKEKYQLELPFAFYPASTAPHKNHILLLEALAYLRDKCGLDIRLVCTGSLNDYFLLHIKKRVAELKLWNQVKFLGWVPEEDLRAIYRLSQFLVMPTLFEGFGFPIFEAWLEGTPVACSNVTSLPDQVKDAAVIFNPNQVGSIADALAKVATNVELQHELQKRGYQRLTDFDWERAAKAFRAVYRRAASPPSL
jgi:glycosyltransferase involved in cell wall biosynthesis